MDQVRGFFRYFLNFYAALSRGHKHHTTRATVDYRAQVQLLVDVGRRFNQNLVNRLTMCVCLVGHQTFAQPVFSECADVFFTVYHFHTARFTTATGMNLTFHPRAGTNFRCGFFCFTWRGAGITGWCR